MTDSPVHTPRYFKKRPVVVEAYPWFKNGDHPEDKVGEPAVDPFNKEVYARIEGAVVQFYRNPDVAVETTKCKHCDKLLVTHGWIETLEGGHIVCPGDWIITGTKGEHWPVKPDIFAETYEEVSMPEKIVIEV